MGRLMVNAIVARDYPLVMGAAAVYTTIVLSRISRAISCCRSSTRGGAREDVAANLELRVLATSRSRGAGARGQSSCRWCRTRSTGIGDVLALRLSPPWSRALTAHFTCSARIDSAEILFVRMMLAAASRSPLDRRIAVGERVGTAWVRSLRGWVERPTRSSWRSPTRCSHSPPRSPARLCGTLASGICDRCRRARSQRDGWASRASFRAELLGVKTRPFIDAATALGASSQRVLWRHALPNALGPAIVSTTLGVGNAILLESGLSFLGLGIHRRNPVGET
jgi:hypothetical protein